MKPCWEINERWPKFCASLANGRGRCRKGKCFLVDGPAADKTSRRTRPPANGPETATQRSLL